jgi:2-phosphosulfolactate phosphatase
MRIDVALLPDLVANEDSIFAVVDVLRASSAIVTLLERGVPAMIPAASVEEARELRERLPDHLLCGERNSLPPAGFDHGNSPTEFATLEPRGRSAILATSNGTRVLARLAAAPAVLVGALLNREATAKALLALATERGRDATVVCAGAAYATALALEDALGAGAIVEAALRFEGSLQSTDAALLARDAFLARRGNLPDALISSAHGAELMAAGFSADIDYCARLDVSSVVPLLQRDTGGLLRLAPHRP